MDRRSFMTGALCGLFALKAGPAAAQFYGYGQPIDGPAPPAPAMPQGFLHPTLASNSSAPVGVRLVCSYDVSGSVDDAEHKVQIEVMADAIGSDDFAHAVFYQGGPQSIAVSVMDFGSSASLRIGWMDVRKGEERKLKLLADEIRALPRRESGGTSHVAELQQGITIFDNCPWQAKRTIFDSVTDGNNNTGSMEDLKAARDTLITKHEATINALVTIADDKDIEDWAKEHLITPARFRKANGGYIEPGFVKVVATQENDQGAIVKYRDAMKLAFRRKLFLEVAGIEPEFIEALRKSGALDGSGPASLLPRLSV